jgi:hypothetical protein
MRAATSPPDTAQPQASPQNYPATETEDDLIGLGPDIVVAGELVTVGSAEWVVRIKKFIVGDVGTLVAFIDRFGASSPNDRYVLVNALGDGRSLRAAPTLTTSGDAHGVCCPVAPGFPRKECGTPQYDGHVAGDERSLYRKRQHRARLRRRRTASSGAAMSVDAPGRKSV